MENESFDEAKNTVEDLKNQFIAKLNNLYTKDIEKYSCNLLKE